MSMGAYDAVDGLEQGLASDLGLCLLFPSLIPWAVGGGFNHVVTVETGDRDERDGLGVVANFLDEVGSFLDDFVVASLGPFRGIHLVDRNDELADTEGVGKKGMLAGLTVFGNACFELASTCGDDQDGAVGLGGARDHVFDEITMAGGVNCDSVSRCSTWMPDDNASKRICNEKIEKNLHVLTVT